jgi:phenylpropionate dioxygenase-like ring-hydroxylating dioxygenase large terminal subunit
VTVPGGPGWNAHHAPRAEGASFPPAEVDPALTPELGEAERSELWLCCVYPSHVFAVTAGSVVWVRALPESTTRTRVAWGYAQLAPFPAPATPEGDAYRAAITAGTDAINAEDRRIVETVQAGAASRCAEAGRLSPLERPLWEFQRWLAARLVPEPLAGGGPGQLG